MQYGLISEKKAHTIEKEEKVKKIHVKKSRWAQLADKIHQEAPLEGKSEEFLKLTREYKANAFKDFYTFYGYFHTKRKSGII